MSGLERNSRTNLSVFYKSTFRWGVYLSSQLIALKNKTAAADFLYDSNWTIKQASRKFRFTVAS